MMTDRTAARRPVFALIGLSCPILAVPLARLAADVFVTGEDLAGYYGLWVGLVTLLVAILAGCVATIVSFRRAERPRLLSIVAAAANVVAVLFLIVMTR